MKHFDKIGMVNIHPVLKLLPDYEGAWGISTFRQSVDGTPHADTEAIFLRMPPIVTLETIFDDLNVIEWPLMAEPAFADLIKATARLAYAEPARAMLVKLLPGGVIAEHSDQGDYAEATDRYHVVLQTNAKAEMRIGNELVSGKLEEVWWFDKSTRHSCRNDGDTSRIHLILDTWKD